MSELLQAAKAVISAWDDQYRSIDMRLKNLRAAVERAEKQEAVGFYEYWSSEKFRWDKNLQRDVQAVWTAAQQAERERCAVLCERIPYGSGLAGITYAEAIRGQGYGGSLAASTDTSFEVSELLEKIDA